MNPQNSDGPGPRGPRPSSSFDGDWSRPKPFDAAAKPDPDDAYEAAMRAADALFTRPEPSQPEPSAKVASQPSRTTGEDPESPATLERGGRILRVLDEPPPQEFAALEAAYAPKRRGRKPGSKNKPKVAYPTTTPEPAATLPPAEAYVEAVPTEASSISATPAIQTVEAIMAPTGAPRAERRAPWARDRVKPGEGWKRRRLPRVCW